MSFLTAIKILSTAHSIYLNISNYSSLVYFRALRRLEVLGNFHVMRFMWILLGLQQGHSLCRTLPITCTACISLGDTGMRAQLFCPLSLRGNGMNYIFWTTLAASKAILMYNVKTRENVLRKFPSFLVRVLYLWSSEVCKVKLVTTIWKNKHNSRKWGYQKVLSQS